MILAAKSQNWNAAVPIDCAAAPLRQQHLLYHWEILEARWGIARIPGRRQSQYNAILAVVQSVEVNQVKPLDFAVTADEVVAAEHDVIVKFLADYPNGKGGALEMSSHFNVAERFKDGQEAELLRF